MGGYDDLYAQLVRVVSVHSIRTSLTMKMNSRYDSGENEGLSEMVFANLGI